MTNLIGNSNGMTLEGWDIKGAAVTIEVSTEQACQNTHAWKVVTPGSGAGEGIQINIDVPYARAPVSAATQYTLSASVYYVGAAFNFDFFAQNYDAGPNFLSNDGETISHNGTGCQRFTHTFTSHASAVYERMFVDTTIAGAITFYLDAVQLELGPVATAYEETGPLDPPGTDRLVPVHVGRGAGW